MILTCPSCSKRFLLDAGLLGTGRKVKCGACAHVWFQDPPPPERAAGAKAAAKPAASAARRAVPEPAPEPEIDFDGGPGPGRFNSFLEEMEAATADADAPGAGAGVGAEPPVRPRRPIVEEPAGPPRWKVALPWAGLAASIALVGVGLYSSRDMIVAAWPAANGLYELAGMPVEPFDAGLEAVHIAEFREVEGNPMLFVTGEVRNTSSREREVPDIVATALGPDGRPVQSWLITPSTRRLPPFQSASFSSVQPETRGEAKEVAIAFQPPPK